MPGRDYTHCLVAEQSLEELTPYRCRNSPLAKDITENLDESIVRIKNKEGTIGRLLYDDTIYKELEALIIDVRKHPWKLFRRPKKTGKK